MSVSPDKLRESNESNIQKGWARPDYERYDGLAEHKLSWLQTLTAFFHRRPTVEIIVVACLLAMCFIARTAATCTSGYGFLGCTSIALMIFALSAFVLAKYNAQASKEHKDPPP